MIIGGGSTEDVALGGLGTGLGKAVTWYCFRKVTGLCPSSCLPPGQLLYGMISC